MSIFFISKTLWFSFCNKTQLIYPNLVIKLIFTWLSSRLVEDYAIVYCGATLFKVLRLIIVAASSVHFFACIFFRVKILSAQTPEEVSSFYVSKGVDLDVSSVVSNVYSRPDRLNVFQSEHQRSIRELFSSMSF